MFSESYIIGFKEGLKAGLVWYVLSSYLTLNGKRPLIRFFHAGVLVSALIAAAMFFFFPGMISAQVLGKVISTSFAVFFMLSAGAFIHASGVHLFGKDRSLPGKTLFLNFLVFVTTVVFFSPDIQGSLFFLRELYRMGDDSILTYTNALIGTVLALALSLALVRLDKNCRMGQFFDVPQILLFLAMVKLLGSGIRGFSELSLIPSVQGGFMKFIHDVVHQVLVLLMIPDHPLLRTTTWNFIGVLFGADLASLMSLVILLFFPIVFLYHRLFKTVPEKEAPPGALGRKMRARDLFDRRKKALPVLVFISLIVFAWFQQRGEPLSRIFIPDPLPVVVEQGMVVIPARTAAMDVMDGAMHTFSIAHGSEEIRIMAVKKTDGTISVCLDACEICPPDGYGQKGDSLVCIYCGTPIHLDSLGKPGGCNPIPLSASIEGGFVKIELDEVLKKWGFVKKGK